MCRPSRRCYSDTPNMVLCYMAQLLQVSVRLSPRSFKMTERRGCLLQIRPPRVPGSHSRQRALRSMKRFRGCYYFYAQSQDRNHRIGQTLPVTYLRIIAADTIEEAIVKALERKTVMAGNLLGDTRDLPSVGDDARAKCAICFSKMRCLMPDRLSPARRSWNMSRIKGMNTSPEWAARRCAYTRGLRCRIHVMSLPGRPDMVFQRERLVVFIDGDFLERLC